MSLADKFTIGRKAAGPRTAVKCPAVRGLRWLAGVKHVQANTDLLRLEISEKAPSISTSLFKCSSSFHWRA